MLQEFNDEEYTRISLTDTAAAEDPVSTIRYLLDEQQRKEDYQRRLQRKLQRLEHDLSERREEVEGLQRTLALERNKHDAEHESLRRERETKVRNQKERIRDYLSEVLYSKPPTRDRKKGSYELETVLVTFVKPNDTYRYSLSFRIDDGTTIVQLRENTCKYWGVNPEDFILKTMANNKCQDTIRVKECFRQGEIAVLRLEKKLMHSSVPPAEVELKAIQPKVKRKAKHKVVGFNAEDADKVQQFAENYSSLLKRMGGIYFLLRLRDTKPSEHVAKIKLRDIILYSALAITTWAVYNSRRPIGHSYWYVHGVEEAFMTRVPRTNASIPAVATPSALEGLVPSFREVKTKDDVWDWLSLTLPAIVWPHVNVTNGTATLTGNQLHDYNFLAGFMSIRVQKVKTPNPAWQFCDRNDEITKILPGAACYPDYVTDDTEETGELVNITQYWNNVSDYNSNFRGPMKPGLWMSAAENRRLHNVGPVWGSVDVHTASGYGVDYNLDSEEALVSEYRKDLAEFRRLGWISETTRVVIISLTTYNYDYDMWAACEFLFELPPSGAIGASYVIRPFRPRVTETRAELTETYVDYCRLIIAIYILLFVGFLERKHKTKNHKAGYLYHVSLNGITDVGMVACIFCVTIWRWAEFQSGSAKEFLEQSTNPDIGFWSRSDQAFSYQTIFIVEGILMVFVMYRMLSFFRLNRTVYILWHALGHALTAFIYFCLMFLPSILGFVLILHEVLGPYSKEYYLLSSTMLQVYKYVHGDDVDVSVLVQLNAIWAMIFVFIFYIVVTFLLMNVFLTIVVDAYYVVKLTSSPGERWDRWKFLKWIVPELFVNVARTIMEKLEASPESA